MAPDFGIDAGRVYADDGIANPAFWTAFPDHPYGSILTALKNDATVTAAIHAKFNDPENESKRAFVIEHINRATVNCIGQHIVNKPINPESASFTIYNLLQGGTAQAVDQVIGAVANAKLHTAFATQNADDVIALISRQTGRALFQTSLHQAVAFGLNPAAIVDSLKTKLIEQANGIIPGI